MGFGGLIFVVIALAWLGYLVPLFLHRHENGLLEEPLPDEPITPSVTIVRRGVPLDVAEEETALVSTPLNRRAALRELDLVDARAAIRRRIVLGVLLSAATVLGVLAALGRVEWWSVAVPGGLIAAFLGVAGSRSCACAPTWTPEPSGSGPWDGRSRPSRSPCCATPRTP